MTDFFSIIIRKLSCKDTNKLAMIAEGKSVNQLYSLISSGADVCSQHQDNIVRHGADVCSQHQDNIVRHGADVCSQHQDNIVRHGSDAKGSEL